MQVGFIGAGNMGRAIIDGLLAALVVRESNPETFVGFDLPLLKTDISVSAAHPEKLAEYCKQRGISYGDNESVARTADVLVIAVKPHMFAPVLAPLAEGLSKRKPCVVSVAAGLAIESISAILKDPAVPVMRAMPNIGARIGAGVTALCQNSAVSPEQASYATSIFAASGRVVPIDESLFSVFSAVGSASLAYAFQFIEALAKAGLQGGMTKTDATMTAAQALFAASAMVLRMGEHPCALADTVCSPGGTTIAGLAALEKGAFTATVMEAAAATVRRDRELGQIQKEKILKG